MNTATKKIIRDLCADNYRVIFKKDGSCEIRETFFYRHGKDALNLWNKVRTKLTLAGVKASCTETGEEWGSWPKESYWFVRFTA